MKTFFEFKMSRTLRIMAIVTLLCAILVLSLSSCMKEEDYYTKSDIDSLVSMLEDELDKKASDNEAKINALKAEYEAKINALKAEYEAKIAELEATNSYTKNETTFTYLPNKDGSSITITGIASSLTTDIIIPSQIEGVEVTRIGEWAFKSQPITSIIIPDSVTSIGDEAFLDCKLLTSVTIGKNVTRIESSAFDRCYKIIEVINHSSLDITAGSSGNGFVASNAIEVHTGTSKVVYKGDYLFYTCGGVNYLTYIGDDTELVLPESYNGEAYEIYENAFSGRTLTSITIPDSVTSIGDYAFMNCRSLTSVTIGDSVTSIGSYAFEGCTKLTSVTISDSVTSIGYEAFYGCTSLKNIIIPDSVTSIGNWAFGGCESLTSITIPNSVKSIGDYAFYSCDNLTSVTIENGVTSIGEDAFVGCDSLTSITIPDSVTSIGKNAFKYCTSLTSVTIGNSVTSIGEDAFRDCTSLTSVTIGNSVTSIGEDAFHSCTNLTSVYITNIVAWCGISFGNNLANPLYYAGNLYLNGELVTELVIPEGVTSIGVYAFYRCGNITSVTIPNSVTSIGDSAFYSRIENIKYEGTIAEWRAISLGEAWYNGSTWVACSDGFAGI